MLTSNAPQETDAQSTVTASADNKASPTGETPSEKKLSLAELFLTEESDGSDSADETDGEGGPVDSIDKAAKRLSLEMDKAYGIKVPLANGQSMTIGELKDKVQQFTDFEQQQIQYEETRRNSESRIMRAQSELRSLLSMIPREQLKPELIEKIKRQHDTTLTVERGRTLEVIPEWRSDEIRDKELEGMTEFIQEYGFEPEFIEQFVDHRALKMLRDFWRQSMRIRKAVAEAKTERNNGGKQRQQTPVNKRQAAPQSRRKVVTQQDKLTKALNL